MWKNGNSSIKVAQENLDNGVSNDYSIQLNPGDNVNCRVGNHYVEPELSIEKLNNVDKGLK